MAVADQYMGGADTELQGADPDSWQPGGMGGESYGAVSRSGIDARDFAGGKATVADPARPSRPVPGRNRKCSKFDARHC